MIFKRKWIIFSILIVMLAGFYSKFYNGPLQNWINDSFGGIVYVVL